MRNFIFCAVLSVTFFGHYFQILQLDLIEFVEDYANKE